MKVRSGFGRNASDRETPHHFYGRSTINTTEVVKHLQAEYAATLALIKGASPGFNFNTQHHTLLPLLPAVHGKSARIVPYSSHDTLQQLERQYRAFSTAAESHNASITTGAHRFTTFTRSGNPSQLTIGGLSPISGFGHRKGRLRIVEITVEDHYTTFTTPYYGVTSGIFAIGFLTSYTWERV